MDEQSEDRQDVNVLTPIYTGGKEYEPSDREQRDYRLYPYMPSKGLREAVNLAIYLERPLLIKGEPGSGKTRLAFAVAHEFSKKYYEELKKEYESELAEKAAAGELEPEKKPDEGQAGGGEAGDEEKEPHPFEVQDDKGYLGWPFYFWPVKSTSRAQDGLYVYDAVGRLHNAGLRDGTRKPDRVKDYINYGPLGKAFRYGALAKEFKSRKMRPIVLIDEIDKADIDFPNDLLIELEDPKFKVREMKDKEIKSEVQPIIFVTSNDEKDLPDAFLRRCIFFYIDFPKKDLAEIVRKRVPEHNEKLVLKAVEVFLKLRDELEEKKGRARKLPSTSELIDWVKALHRNTAMPGDDEAISEEAFQKLDSPKKIREYFENLDHGEKLMVEQVENLLDGRLPFLSVLIKNYEEYEEYVRQHKEEQENETGSDEPDSGQPAPAKDQKG